MSTHYDSTNTLTVGNREQRPTYTHPSYLVKTDEGASQLAIALPGVSRDDLNVSLEKGLLTVTGNRASGELHAATEPSSGGAPEGYQLQTRLHPDLNPEAMSAQLENGILTLVIPEKESAKKRNIPIN